MFGCYRKGDANDADTYVAAVAGVLADYDMEVIRRVTDPRYGLPRRLSFMPTVKEVVDDCEIEQRRQDSMNALKGRETRRISYEIPNNNPGIWATISVSPDAPQYQRFKARTMAADVREWRWDGSTLWVAASWFDTSGLAAKAFVPFTDEQLREKYCEAEAI